MEVPTITYFEDFGFGYQPSLTTSLQYQPAVPQASSPYYSPDIAVGFDQVNNEFCCVVSCVQADNGNSFTVYEYEFKPSSPTAFVSNYSNTVTNSVPFALGVARPRICAPPTFNTSPVNHTPFGICFSNSPLASPWSSSNLVYAHFDATNVNEAYPDGQNAYGYSYCGEPVIEYMQDTPGLMAREACMAWPAAINTGSNIEFGIYALMDPFINNVYYDWSQVNLTPITTPNNIRFSTAIAATWDNSADEYVIAWLSDSLLSLKIRPMHTTNFRPSRILKNTVALYPNPAQNAISLEMIEDTEFTILNALGVALFKGRGEKGMTTLVNTSTLPNGHYLVTFGAYFIPFIIAK